MTPEQKVAVFINLIFFSVGAGLICYGFGWPSYVSVGAVLIYLSLIPTGAK